MCRELFIVDLKGLTEGAVDRWLRRLMSPKSRGQYKVPDPVREMFADPDPERKSEVLQMFAECGYDPEAFAKRYKFTVSKERESELEMPFEFLSKDEMREGSGYWAFWHRGECWATIGAFENQTLLLEYVRLRINRGRYGIIFQFP